MTACGAVIWEDAAVEAFDLFMQNLLDILVSNAIHLFELVGVVVLIVAGV